MSFCWEGVFIIVNNISIKCDDKVWSIPVLYILNKIIVFIYFEVVIKIVDSVSKVWVANVIFVVFDKSDFLVVFVRKSL